MTPPKASPKVLVFGPQADEYARQAAIACPGLDVSSAADQAALDAALPDTEILIAPRFPLDSLARARSLRWFQCSNAGIDFLVPARDRLGGVTVTNARGIHAEGMADYTLGVMTMLHWDFPGLLRDQQARRWDYKLVPPLADCTLGVIGLGSIGAAIARRGAAAGMTVLGLKREPAPVEGVERVFGPAELAELLPRCDFVVLVVPLTRETRGMIGAAELALMKPSAFLVNIARGAVVDEPALIEALRGGRLAGAGLDVFVEEPLPEASPLWSMPNVIVTPHIAGNPDEYPRRVIGIFADNLRRFLAGQPLRNVVDLARGY